MFWRNSKITAFALSAALYVTQTFAAGSWPSPQFTTQSQGDSSAYAATDKFVNNNGAPVLLDLLTGSNSASLTDSACVNSTFRMCEIVFENVVPSTAGAGLGMQVEVGGTWETSGYGNDVQYFRGEGSNSGTASTSAVQFTATYGSNTTENPGTSNGITGSCLMVNPAYATTVVNPITCDLALKDDGGDIQRLLVAGDYGTAATIQGFKFLESAGNESGIIAIYGFM